MSNPQAPADNPDVGQERVLSAPVVPSGPKADDQLGLYKDDGKGLYPDYALVNEYVDAEQIYMMPISSPGGFQGQQVAFVQLAAPTLILAARWTACRVGSKPQIPNPVLTDPNWKFIGKVPEVSRAYAMDDGVTLRWRISGVYLYGKKNPSADTFPDMVWPIAPDLDLPKSKQDQTVPSILLQQGLIDILQGGQGQSPGPGGQGQVGGGAFGGTPGGNP